MSLTTKQQAFLDALFTEECKGNPKKALIAAGYSPTTPSTAVTRVLKSEIAEATKEFLATKGTRAAWAMSEIMDDPTELGNKEKMAAAKDVLDRAGFVKTDKVEVKAASPLFILPEKEEDNGEEESKN